MAVLHTEFSTSEIEESKISAYDKKTYSYIEKYGDISYDPVIAEETDWRVFYNLTELRKGILSWYDFPASARVLEAGAAFGTLTGCLCRKCAHVTATDRSLYRARAVAARYRETENLDIYAGDAAEIEFPESFDFIILIGLLERVGNGSREPKPYIDYLSAIKRWLKPGGRLLFAVENRFGLRYFCGEAEPHTGRAFDGINGYPRGTGGHSFSRKEIETIVKAAGFGYRKFYYPLPDYKLPQLIYTDACLPGKNLRERLIPYYRRRDTLVAWERELYQDILENHVFPFFANSFLAECGGEEFPGAKEADRGRDRDSTVSGSQDAEPGSRAVSGQILYAAVSTDRGEARSYATVIRGDGTVRKTPLYEKGRADARKLYANILDLQAHGIPVVRHKLLEGDELELPYIPWPTLSDHIKEIIYDRQEEFLGLIDRIYAYILQSSPQVPEEENALPAVLGIRPGHFGPILRKAYMELIPLNCFYNPRTGEFLYFDQEFVREKYPAKYVLFRAIHYIYCFTPNAERYYPKGKLLQKYGMEDTWDIYLREETRFLDQVRNRGQYKQFYQRTMVDQRQISENIGRLENSRETGFAET